LFNQLQQVYHLTSEANLILLDWLIAGRIALGEVWDMTRYRRISTRTSVASFKYTKLTGQQQSVHYITVRYGSLSLYVHKNLVLVAFERLIN